MSNYRAILLVSILLTVGMASACGGSTSTPTNSGSVTIFPAAISVDQGAGVQFSATVVGNSNPAVTWSIQEGSAGGSISQTGLYTAPTTATAVHVIATSVSGPGESAIALVTVNAVSLSMPSTAGVPRGRKRQFAAEVAGTVRKDVTWAVDEGSTGGTITSDGTYTAPMSGGPFHVTARSAADPSKAATAAVVLTDAGFRKLDTSVLTPRTSHTVTLLPNGKVLIVGGEQCDASNCSGRLSSAELFDPAREIFSYTGAMSIARAGHTATLLNNGTVLVTGGGDSSGDDRTAEIYDPATGGFSRAGDMAQGRTRHTASLLGDGRVLVAGGVVDVNGFGLFSSKTAELYDPTTKTFSPARDMPTEAESHTASVLLDGTVLMAGGYDNDCPGTQTASAIFDPNSKSFSPSIELPTARAEHTATRLNDGRLLITGGNFVDFCNFGSSPHDTAVVFAPATSSYSPEIRMSEPRARHSATLLADGKVLVVGSTAELFDPGASSFSITGDPNAFGNDRRSIRLSDGRVLFISSWVSEIYE